MTTKEIITNFNAGLLNPVEVAKRLMDRAAQLKEEDSLMKQFKSNDLIDYLREFKNEYPEGYKGMNVEIRGGRTTWDFKGIEEVDQAVKELKDMKEKYVNAYYLLQKGIAPVEEETGEVLDVPSCKSGAESLIFTKKK